MANANIANEGKRRPFVFVIPPPPDLIEQCNMYHEYMNGALDRPLTALSPEMKIAVHKHYMDNMREETIRATSSEAATRAASAAAAAAATAATNSMLSDMNKLSRSIADATASAERHSFTFPTSARVYGIVHCLRFALHATMEVENKRITDSLQSSSHPLSPGGSAATTTTSSSTTVAISSPTTVAIDEVINLCTSIMAEIRREDINGGAYRSSMRQIREVVRSKITNTKLQGEMLKALFPEVSYNPAMAVPRPAGYGWSESDYTDGKQDLDASKFDLLLAQSIAGKTIVSGHSKRHRPLLDDVDSISSSFNTTSSDPTETSGGGGGGGSSTSFNRNRSGFTSSGRGRRIPMVETMRNPGIECHNCGGKGHIARTCPTPSRRIQ